MRHELTEDLRTSRRPYFIGLRRALAEKEIDPQTAALAESFDDDEHLVHGVVVAADGRIYEFDYTFADAARIDDGKLTIWSEIPRTWDRLADRSEILVAVRYLGLRVDL